MTEFLRLHDVERRYEELAHRMSAPDAAAQPDVYARMMKDYKELTPLVEEYRRYTALRAGAEGNFRNAAGRRRTRRSRLWYNRNFAKLPGI